MTKYGTYNRQSSRRKSDATKDIIVKAFHDAWAEGKTFSISMEDDMLIRVKVGRNLVASYAEPNEFAKDFFGGE